MDEDKPTIQTESQSGGVNITGGNVIVFGDIVGGNQIVQALPPAVRALHSIPPPPRDLIDRTAEIEQLVNCLSQPQGPALAGIFGMGGVGVTALARHVADKVSDRYPDAQIQLDLHGTDPNPMTPADAMAYVIHAFEPQADLSKVAESQLPGLYQSVLYDKHVVLLLDNAHDDAQVESLLPPRTCALLVTSRRKLAVSGLDMIRLDVLAPEHARALLLGICSRIGSDAERLAELCGRLPLALHLAGSYLKTHELISPAAYCDQLAAHPLDQLKTLGKGEENVESVLNLSYAQLAPEAQTFWRMLAVFPAPFDAVAVAAVWQVEQDAAISVLSDCLALNLIEHENNRFHLPNLLRAFADARLSDAERSTAQQRHAARYLQVVSQANDLYYRGGANIATGLSLFDAEFPHIRAGQAWAAEHWQDDDAIARLCSDYARRAISLLFLRLKPRDCIRWLESGLAAARKLGARSDESAHLNALGSAYSRLGEGQQVVSYYEQALAIDRELGDRHNEGIELGGLAVAYFWLREMDKCIKYAEQALAIAREFGDRENVGNNLRYLGAAYTSMGEMRKAIACQEQALAIARDSGDRQGEANALGNLSAAYASLGKPQETISYAEQALQIYRELGDRRGEGIALDNLARAHIKLGDLRTALPLAESALEIYTALESPYAENARRQVEYLRQQLASEKAPAPARKRVARRK